MSLVPIRSTWHGSGASWCVTHELQRHKMTPVRPFHVNSSWKCFRFDPKSWNLITCNEWHSLELFCHLTWEMAEKKCVFGLWLDLELWPWKPKGESCVTSAVAHQVTPVGPLEVQFSLDVRPLKQLLDLSVTLTFGHQTLTETQPWCKFHPNLR